MMNKTELMNILNTAGRETFRETIRGMQSKLDRLAEIRSESQNAAETISRAAAEMTIDGVGAVLATLLAVHHGDGRISDRNRAALEALDIPGWERELALGKLHGFDNIHCAHLDQLAAAFAKTYNDYKAAEAAKPEAVEEEAAEAGTTPAEVAETTAAAETAVPTYSIVKNEQFNSNEIYFPGKPDQATRDALKGLKFRWHSQKKCWYGKASVEEIRAAIDGASAPLVVPESVEVIEGGLYDGWRGGNSRKWRSYEELKKFLSADFKKAGISATIRKGNAGYLTAITVTMAISREEIRSFSEFETGYTLPVSGWINYTRDDGAIDCIYSDYYYSMNTAEDQEAFRANAADAEYKCMLREIENGYEVSRHTTAILSDSAKARFELVHRIVDSYNHDQSNIMIDYFDRGIYDSYCIKIA